MLKKRYDLHNRVAVMRFGADFYKISLLMTLGVGGIAHADIPFTKDDLVGTWHCHIDDQQLKFRSESVIENRANGTQTERSTMYLDNEDSEFYQIEQVRASTKWRLDGDVMVLYDGVIHRYKVDVPNYNEQNFDVSKQTFILAQTVYGRAELQKSLAEEMPARIKFIDKNTYTWAEVDEDFIPVEQQYCKRIVKQKGDLFQVMGKR